MEKIIKGQKAITLIALIITIIVLIILAGVSIMFLFGADGIIAKAQLSAFGTEMQKIKENVVLKQNNNAIEIASGNNVYLFEKLLNEDEIKLPDTLKQEFLYVRDGYPSDKNISDYNTEDFDAILQNNTSLNNGNAIYVIDKETGEGKENTYIYDMQTNIVFKIKQTKIAGKVYHSYEVAKIGKGGADAPTPDQIIESEPSVVVVNEEYYYSPNMKGFSKNDTKLIYYSADFSKQIEVPVEQYINSGEPNQITKNVEGTEETYTLHDYKNQIWANVKTTGNGLEGWWVWIPRYAYKINSASTNPPIDIIFIDLDDKPLNPMYNGNLPEGYIPHPAFTPSGTDGSKNLKGIWMSKYQPSNTFSYEPTSSECYAPDMSGFDVNQTYIELYDTETSTFTDVRLADANLNTINNNNTWYDYKNKIWANIKTTGNGLEAWWVWIPRYAYQINGVITEVNIIFIDLNDKPIDKETYGNNLPEGYIVHPAFKPSGTDGSKNLKGIWMSKYQPSWTDDVVTGTTPTGASSLEYADDQSATRHTHVPNGVGTTERYVTTSTNWCTGYDGTPCSNYGYYRYCSLCGVRLRYYWCKNHYNKDTKVLIDDSNVQ